MDRQDRARSGSPSTAGEAGGGGAYARAGVNVAAGAHAVSLFRERLGGSGAFDLLGGLGGFAAAVALPAGFREPVLVTATDGVGTKTEIARALGRRDTIGQDLVAMCADDVVCHGARPFLFLDYLAVGRVVPEAAAELVAGIARACERAGCGLVGGETAEHPGVMEPDQFDLAGFCLGIAERDELLDGSSAEVGDSVVGLAASGLHANGYSLVRAVLERERIALGAPLGALVRERLGAARVIDEEVIDEDPRPGGGDGRSFRTAAERTLGGALLAPTPIYAPAVLGLRAALVAAGIRLSGIAHVTGGGLPGNLPRAVGPDLGIEADPTRWPEPLLVRLIGELAGLAGAERRATFHGGIGMALVVEPDGTELTLATLAELGIEAWQIGRVVSAAVAGPTRYREIGG